MGLRGWLLCVALVILGWWFSPLSPRVPQPVSMAAGQSVGCVRPPQVLGSGIALQAAPLQSDVPASMPPFRLQAATLQPLAGFSIDARVLSREDYNFGREAEFSPTDLALGWQRMREDAVLSQLDISQSGRWYNYRWRDQPPIPTDEIVRSSANMHMIPSDEATAAALRRVKRGDRVRIDGWLVQVDTPDNWHWRSSTSREDSGAGACEVVYVCSITTL